MNQMMTAYEVVGEWYCDLNLCLLDEHVDNILEPFRVRWNFIAQKKHNERELQCRYGYNGSPTGAIDFFHRDPTADI